MLFTIVGGGPIGLITAIIFKTLFTKWDIKVLESREKKTRNQIVYFKPYTLRRALPENIVERLVKEGKGCYMMAPDRNQSGICFKKRVKEGHSALAIQIHKLEEVLEQYAIELEVKIIRQTVMCNDDIVGDIIVGADGVHSCVRTALLKSASEPFTEYQSYGFAMTYDEDNKKSKNGRVIINVNSEFNKKVNLSHLDQHRKRFFRTDDKSYIGLQISKQEYETIVKSGSTIFKDLPIHLQKTVEQYITLVNSKPINLGDSRISVFPITITGSTLYGSIVNGIPVFLIGDAAISSHFFTAYGINAGIEQARFLLRLFHAHSTEYQKIVDEYNKQMAVFAKDAINEAINVYLPLDQLDTLCLNINDEELKKLAKEEHIQIGKLSKHELCYILSRRLLLENTNFVFRG